MTSGDIAETFDGELVPYDPPVATGLFGTDNPKAVIVRATEVSDALARVIRDRNLYARISGKEHVLVEGWTLLGSMLGVFPVTVWTRRVEDGWEARVEARTLAGAVVGAAQSECLRSERRWQNADDYAIHSMAQTRATSKALRMPLGFVMQLAGFEATPADEIPDSLPDTSRPTDEQKAELRTLVRSLEQINPDTDWAARCREIAGVPSELMTRTIADGLIRKLEQELRDQAEQANR